MKKLIILISFFFNITVYANNIYSIDMDIYIDSKGTANITEYWDVKGNSGTEWYKGLGNLGNSVLSDFKVYMDNEELQYKIWDINESLNEKKGFYGIYRGNELCFGKYDYKRHTFKLEYKLSNFIFNTSDAQVLYWNLIDELSDVTFSNYNITVSSYYEFPDDLEVWGFGNKGYAYVSDGKIHLSNEGRINSYVVLLARFPSNTFDNNNTYIFDTFEEVLNKANENTFSYNYNSFSIFEFIISLMSSLIPMFLIIKLINKTASKFKYGYINNKKIDKKNTPIFRDIPCDKDIYLANALAILNNFNANKNNILGAIILKWIKEDVVKIKEESLILDNAKFVTLTKPSYEKELFTMFSHASTDGILEKKALNKYAKKNYEKYFRVIEDIGDSKIKELKDMGKIYKRKSKDECKYYNVMDDSLYEESKKLYGFKLFLEKFSNMKEKEAIEVKLWDQYLMFAYIFGMADKVAKQFKNLYPEVLEEINSYNNLDIDTILFVNRLSASSVSAASSARSAAESYSSGGGGFSSGGGGGGSFGGGGGGSR